MLITAYPYRYLGPQALTFNSAEAFDRLRGDHSSHEYYRFDYDATTYEQDNLVGLVPVDPHNPAEWFAFVDEFAPTTPAPATVPLGAYVLAVSQTEKRLLNMGEFRDALERLKLTPESHVACDADTERPLPPFDTAPVVCYKGKEFYIETVNALDKAADLEETQQSLEL